MTRRPRRPLRAGLLLLAALASALLAGCGEMEETETAVTDRTEVTLVLDYFPNADHAAIYAAQQTGAFERAGLDVMIQPPPEADAPLQLLQAGRADVVISYEPDIILARAEGAKIQGVGALVQQPLASLMSLSKEPIRSPEELRGARVGTAGLPYQAAYLRAILANAGVPADSVKRVDLGFNLTQPLLAGRVDAVLGAFWNYEAVELERRDRPVTVLRLEELGVPTYDELVLAATEETVGAKGPMLRRLLQAITEGARSLRDDPRTGIDPLLRANRALDRGLQTAVLEKTLPVMFPADDAKPFGWQEPDEWEAFARWMQEQGLIDDAMVAARGYTNEYLAGEGVGVDEG